MALVLYGLVTLIMRFANRASATDGKEDRPVDILKMRYAKGEIDAKEFAGRKKDLEL